MQILEGFKSYLYVEYLKLSCFITKKVVLSFLKSVYNLKKPVPKIR